MYGRNGECPLPVIAARGPADCFDAVQEAWRIATRFMTPVILLTDGYIANGSEPWRIPQLSDLKRTEITHPAGTENGDPFLPYLRNERLARPWAVPGTPGLMHRIGGLEKQDVTGNVSYDSANHQKMTDTRAAKINNIANDIPEQGVEAGETKGKLAVVGWGSTFGPINRAVNNMRAKGLDVAHIHIRHIWPLPRNLGDLLGNYDKVLVAEMNNGQMLTLLKSQYLIDAKGLLKVTGQPLKIDEVESAIRSQIGAP